MKVIQVSDRPATRRFYAVAGRLLFIESFDDRLGSLIERLFAGWQLTPVSFAEREPDIRINFFCGDAASQVPDGFNHFEVADGGRCYTIGDDYYVSLGNSLVHLQNSSPVTVDVWLARLPGLIDSVFARAGSFAVCAALRRFGLFELHSAGVVHPRGGKGVLIVGPSGSGKSTLALRLAMAGWPYLSDDELLLNLIDGEVEARGFRSFFAVRNSSPEELIAKNGTSQEGRLAPAANSLREGLNRPFKTCFEPEVVLGSRRQTSAVAGALLFTSVTGEPKTKLIPLTQAEAMARLLRACPWATYDTAVAASNLELLSRLARQTKAFDLVAGRDLLVPGVASDLLSNAVGLH